LEGIKKRGDQLIYKENERMGNGEEKQDGQIKTNEEFFKTNVDFFRDFVRRATLFSCN
jgi:hypothetical protein